MKKKILIFGLTTNYGGIEKITYDLLSILNSKEYQLFFVINSSQNITVDSKLDGFDIKQICFNSRRRGRYKEFKSNLLKLMIDIKPDIVFEVFGDSTYIEPLVFAKKLRISKRIAFATMGGFNEKLSIIYKLRLMVSKIRMNYAANLFLSVSKKSSKFTFLNPSKAAIVSCIDSERFKYNVNDRETIRAKYNVNNDAIVFSEIGRICQDKNQAFAIDFFYKYNKNNPNSCLFLIGNYEEDYYNFLLQKIESLKLQGKVHFLESQPNVVPYYSFSDLILFPSLREGFGLIAVESQANGIPCLVFEETIDQSLKVSDSLLFITKSSNENKILSMVNESLQKLHNREDAYLIVKASPLDIGNKKIIIQKIFD